ncbi:hypothetical protein [Shewanella nanhaiensis]|uniref:Uncharacterized protein n=1 Tax=Shewanella nanhaiensis TaxID=2864872 RepID=A0ABS7E053_9GAMM|nr:hypothetical protein [Shewanella nanhaiensis]MBW8183048.1 hypothetical protein [Shewanella nanhaiensis]
MKKLSWLLIFIPALSVCAAVILGIAHYFHLIDSSDLVVKMMMFILGLNLASCLFIAMKTSGNLPYLLLGNMMFFIVFVFSITTVRNHNCNHHEDVEVFQHLHEFEGINIGVDIRCDTCS